MRETTKKQMLLKQEYNTENAKNNFQLERLLIFPPTTKFMKKSGYVKQHYNVTYHSLVSERIERASDQQPKRPEKFNTKFQRKVNSNDQ